MVARKTVSEVLKGLEGAVITSVRGSSGLGPLQEMFAVPAQTVVPGESKMDGQPAKDGETLHLLGPKQNVYKITAKSPQHSVPICLVYLLSMLNEAYM